MFAHDMSNEFAGEFRGFRGFGGMRGGRMGRGMMEPVILKVLLDKPMHGYEIISTLEEKSHGFWRPSAGSVYPTLQLLEEKGLVTVSDTDGKKVYTLTPDGETEARKVHAIEEHWNDHRGNHQGSSFQEMREMRELMGSMMRDMRAIYRKGSESQRKDMYAAIENLRRELHTITKEKKND